MNFKEKNMETNILEGRLVVVHMNDKIRLDILKFYYDLYKKDSTDFGRYDQFVEIFNITENELIGHVRYLYEKQLLDCICSEASHEYGRPYQCKITAHGIDAIEHPELFARDVPLLNLIINSNISNSQIFQAQSIRIENGFNRVYQAIEGSNLDVESKKELKNYVKDLESEGKKENPNKESMKSLLDKVRKISSSVYDLLKPVMQELITEYTKKQLGF